MAEYEYAMYVAITSPDDNATVSPRFTITGLARFTRWEMREGIRWRQEDWTHNIDGVRVEVRDVEHQAEGTGSGTRRFATWSFEVNPGNVRVGRQRIRAEAHTWWAGGHTDRSDRWVVIEGTPPTLSITPPADVTNPAPPYTATITGTAADDVRVAAVEWRFGNSGAFQAATGTTDWSARVPLPGLGTYDVSLRARDINGAESPEHQVSVRVIDATPPELRITTPPEGETFTLAANGVTVEVRGTASDTQTGVDRVEWALDDQAQFTPAIPKADNDWSTWSAPIPIATAGNRTITIRAKDKVTPTGNVITQARNVLVEQPFVPKDPDAVFSAAAYLDDLLDFATHRAKTAASGGEPISRQLLVDTFLQAIAR